MPQVVHASDRLQSPKHFFDSLPLALADRVSLMPRRALVNRALVPRRVLRHMRRNRQLAWPLDKLTCIVTVSCVRSRAGPFSKTVSFSVN